MVASLSGAQKVAILDGFVKKELPKTISYRTGISRLVVTHLYRAIDAIEERARELMRDVSVVIPAEYDEEGVEITPAVYNVPPATVGELLVLVQDEFVENFTGGQVTAILTKMVEYSKHDGTGDWDFYASKVIL